MAPLLPKKPLFILVLLSCFCSNQATYAHDSAHHQTTRQQEHQATAAAAAHRSLALLKLFCASERPRRTRRGKSSSGLVCLLFACAVACLCVRVFASCDSRAGQQTSKHVGRKGAQTRGCAGPRGACWRTHRNGRGRWHAHNGAPVRSTAALSWWRSRGRRREPHTAHRKGGLTGCAATTGGRKRAGGADRDAG